FNPKRLPVPFPARRIGQDEASSRAAAAETPCASSGSRMRSKEALMFTCMKGGGICVRTINPLADGGLRITPPQFQPPLPVPLTISAPVGMGPKAKNLWFDVTAIQRALNLIFPDDGGALPLLVVDGDCGSKTKNAIAKFQSKNFGWADALIEPGKKTLARLNELLAKVVQKPPTMEDLIRAWGLAPEHVLPYITASFTQARGWILAARGALLAPSGLALLNKHFLFDQQPDKTRAYQHILLIFDRMQQVFARPGGLWGAEAFQPEPVIGASSTGWAFTNAGGFFMAGQSVRAKLPATGQVVVLRFDTIYVQLWFVLSTIVTRSWVIVHELAH